MIANQTLGRGFVGLGSYLLTGRDRVDPSQRVGWIEHRNLPTERLDIAIRIMAGTASLSYTKRPVFHLSISFAPGDPVDAALMKRVMAQTLSDLGLGKHHAVMVAHIDTDDPHVHAMVNRVHPETGVAWKGSWSRLRVEASLRQQELEEGLRVVPGWLAPVPGHPELRPRPRLAHGDEEFLSEVKDRAGPVLERARTRSWADVEAGLAELGLSVRVNGRGMSITDGRREVKASKVGRQFSRGNLEKNLGRYSDYSARVAVASAASVRDPGAASPTPASIESKAYPENSTTSEAQPRFSLYEEGEIVGVWDCVGPQIFFAETRERAEEEMQRANWLAARYPNIRVVRCLRDMDGEWRDARGLPRLPEENGRPLRRRPPPARTEPSPSLPARAELAPAAPLLEAPARPLEPVAAPEIIVEPPTGMVVAGPDHPIARGAERSGPAPAPRPVREYASFLDEVRSQAEPVLRLSESWAELEDDHAEYGLFLRVKGGGFVVTDRQREVKASKVGRECSRFYLEERLGRYPHPPMPVAAADVAPAVSMPAAQPEVPAQHDLPEPRWQAAAPHEAEEPADAPRFTLYEDEGIFGVYDSDGPQVFFSETRQRALEEVERANEIVALYPNTISMRHLREMDGAWRNARGLPRLAEPEAAALEMLEHYPEYRPPVFVCLGEGARGCARWEEADRYAAEAMALARAVGNVDLERHATALESAVALRERPAPEVEPGAEVAALTQRIAARLRRWRRRTRRDRGNRYGVGGQGGKSE